MPVSEHTLQDLMELLLAPLSDEDHRRITERLARLDEARESLQRFETEGGELNLNALMIARLFASDTLYAALQTREKPESRQVLESWFRAGAQMSEWVAAGEKPTLNKLNLLNALVLGKTEGFTVIRSTDESGSSYLEAEEIPSALVALEDHLLPMLNVEPAPLAASRLYQWLVTIRPWVEGNGRTARLAADWLLTMGGYVPVAFKDAPASFVSAFNSPQVTLVDAFETFAEGAERSVRVLTQAPSERSH